MQIGKNFPMRNVALAGSGNIAAEEESTLSYEIIFNSKIFEIFSLKGGHLPILHYGKRGCDRP